MDPIKDQECQCSISHAYTTYCVGQSELKGEDVVFVEHRRPWPGSDLTEHSALSVSSTGSFGTGTGDLDSANVGNRWMPCDFPPSCTECGTTTNSYSLFCVFDGHNGVHAAKMAGEAILPLIEARLPLGCPPPTDHHYYQQFREGIQVALVESLVEINALFAQRGIHAGCTATVVLQQGWLLTAASLGDSRALVDTGFETIPLSIDHRVASHKAERRRVEAMGGIVAPLAMWGSGPADDYASGVGPLRIWPGGLSISRAIGDFDVGEAVLPFPHVTQVMLPPTGGRLLVASDGIWDAFDKMSRAGSMSRNWSTETVPSRMIQTIVRAFGGLKDDTTLIVTDILPGRWTTFPQLVASAKKGGPLSSGGSSNGGVAGNGSSGGFCGCFGGPATVEDGPSIRSGNYSTNGDISVRSMASSTVSNSVRGGKSRAEILASVDVAGIMGLMPEPELVIPGWYTPEIGERLFTCASAAADAWRAAHEKRYARPPATPAMPEVERPRRKGRKVAFAKEAVAAAKAKEEAGTPKTTGGLPRNASQHFSGATADGSEDFASKFGHYTQNSRSAASYMLEPSVRAGRVFNSEASVRAGSAHLVAPEDPSVRLRGSSLEGSVHLKTSALKNEEVASVPVATNGKAELAPVRVVKRTGPISVPISKSGFMKEQTHDSVKEHMLNLTTIGE